jgi:YfiH family protein
LLKSKKLSKNKAIKHGFFNSNGGVSKNIYKSLNCGPGSNDNSANVKKNLNIVRKKISKNSQNIFLLNQIHSNKFVFINNKYKSKIKPKADAIITDQINLPIAVLTADCVPILVSDNQKKMIAAIHAGWKGAFKGIISKVIKFMMQKGSKTKNITAVIGPAISVKNYEVKKDFYKKLTRKNKTNHKFFKMRKEKLYFNLSSYVKSLIIKSGVKKIEKLDVDTFNAKNKFFSARRSKSLNHADYGRNISIIMLN